MTWLMTSALWWAPLGTGMPTTTLVQPMRPLRRQTEPPFTPMVEPTLR